MHISHDTYKVAFATLLLGMINLNVLSLVQSALQSVANVSAATSCNRPEAIIAQKLSMSVILHKTANNVSVCESVMVGAYIILVGTTD